MTEPCDQRSEQFKQASQQKRASLMAEFWAFLLHNKKWWLAPILIVFLLLAGLLILSQSAAAPFIYTLF